MDDRKLLISVRMAVWGAPEDLKRILGAGSDRGRIDDVDAAAAALGLGVPADE
ncbi:hypothetical protein [Oceanicella actignis]|uniref:hypothetical protein n=1 Tax=Oceanicella actignis TaxID=1189325 RepID=UPI0012570E29|nr:hypothetical protein [Oceanicella actignis]TYO91427.1 hypothetical protein LY05_00280 [Oceanicella actignis]